MNAKILVFFIIFLTSNIEFNSISSINCISEFVNPNYDEPCSGDFIIISTIDGVLTALDMNTGQKCWSTLVDTEKFLSSSLSELEIYDKGQRVFLVPSLDGGLYKYDGSNRVIQPLPLNVDSFISQSSYFDSTSIIGGKMKVVFGIHRLTGEVVYKCGIDGCTTFVMPIPDNIIVVEEIIQCVNAVDSVKALKTWHFRVAELKMKLASQVFSEAPSFQSAKENALIPKSFSKQDPPNLDMYKVLLQNGFVGMLNKSGEDFSWWFKMKCPITDAWYLKDDVLKILDPFGKESGFFTMDTEDGNNSALLFLGLYQNQMFIKKSKVVHGKDVKLGHLSTYTLYQNYLSSGNYFSPVCLKSESIVSINDSSPSEGDMVLTYMDYNVSDYGFYFYTNYSIAENATHCIINTTSYIVQYEETIPLSYRLIFSIVICFCVYILMHALFQMAVGKDEIGCVHGSTYGISGEKSIESVEFRSRFHQDFELISILGKGGFGVVIDAKNKIDDCRYAVKRICLREQLNSSQYEKVLREVKALAKLDHHGIVRYFNAWIEYPPIGWQEKRDMESNIFDVSKSNPSSETEVESKPLYSTETTLSKPSTKPDLLKKLDQNPFKPFGDTWSFDGIQNEDSHSQFSDYTQSSNKDDCSWDPEQNSGNLSDDPSTKLIDKVSHSKEKSSDYSIVFENSNKMSSDICNMDDDKENSSDNFIVFENSNNKLNLGICNADDVKEISSDNFIVFEGSNKEMNLETSANDCYSYELCKNKTVSKSSTSDSEKRLFPDEMACLPPSKRVKYNRGTQCNDSLKREQEVDKAISSHKLSSKMSLKDVKNKLSNSLQSSTSGVSKSDGCFSLMNVEKSLEKVPRGYLYIQMQLCQKESLRDWLNENSSSREYTKVMEIFYQIVDAVHYVHNCGLMHRDLKPSNIYFSMEGAIKIGDFGLATSSEIEKENTCSNQQLPNIHTSDIGTEIYMSPEQKRRQHYDYKTDIYSLGIIFFELIVPFQTYSERCQVLSKVRRLKFPEEFMYAYKDESEFVHTLLHEDPKCRPTTSDIKKHPLIFKYTQSFK